MKHPRRPNTFNQLVRESTQYARELTGEKVNDGSYPAIAYRDGYRTALADIYRDIPPAFRDGSEPPSRRWRRRPR